MANQNNFELKKLQSGKLSKSCRPNLLSANVTKYKYVSKRIFLSLHQQRAGALAACRFLNKWLQKDVYDAMKCSTATDGRDNGACSNCSFMD